MEWSFLECLLVNNLKEKLFLTKYKVLNKSSLKLFNLYKRNIFINGNYLKDYFYYLGIELDSLKKDLSIDKFNCKTIILYFETIFLNLDWYHIRKKNLVNNNLLSINDKLLLKSNDRFSPYYSSLKIKKLYLNTALENERLHLLRNLNKCRRTNKYLYSIIF